MKTKGMLFYGPLKVPWEVTIRLQDTHFSLVIKMSYVSEKFWFLGDKDDDKRHQMLSHFESKRPNVSLVSRGCTVNRKTEKPNRIFKNRTEPKPKSLAAVNRKRNFSGIFSENNVRNLRKSLKISPFCQKT